MFTQDTLSTMDTLSTTNSGAYDRTGERTGNRAARRMRGPARTAGPSPARLRQIYVGEREVGHPTMLVVREKDTERLNTAGGFDWGWPSIGGARRLAHTLLLDLTDREPPPWVCDALATDQLTHLPWTTFSLTGRELLEWIKSQGYRIEDWPLAGTSPATPRRLESMMGGDGLEPRDSDERAVALDVV